MLYKSSYNRDISSKIFSCCNIKGKRGTLTVEIYTKDVYLRHSVSLCLCVLHFFSSHRYSTQHNPSSTKKKKMKLFLWFSDSLFLTPHTSFIHKLRFLLLSLCCSLKHFIKHNSSTVLGLPQMPDTHRRRWRSPATLTYHRRHSRRALLTTPWTPRRTRIFDRTGEHPAGSPGRRLHGWGEAGHR